MLSLERKLYQLIISRIDGAGLSSAVYRDRAFQLTRKGVGGFIFFGGERRKVKRFINELQGISEIPLFIASDIERGAGQQFEGATRFPFQMAVAAAINKDGPGDVLLLRNAVKAVADEALDIGINMPLIPVLDVNKNPDNPIICTRAFSDKPEEAAWFGTEYIKILEDAGLISCAKHFPGHGDTAVDSHISLPVISKSLRELAEVDMYPFKKAIKAGVSSIMLGHLCIPAIDKLPASMSEKIISSLLRKELGFDGLILTDALNMHALKEFGSVPVHCLNSGVDVLLHPSDADSAVAELKQAVSSGELKEETIDMAINRIQRFKKKTVATRTTAAIESAEYERNAELAQTIFDKSVTLVKDAKGLLPLKDIQDVRLVLVGGNDMHSIALIESFPGLLTYNSEPLTLNSRTLIFALFTNVSAWKGSSGIEDKEIRRIKELMKSSENSVVISFGSPYVLRHFPEADILIAAYDNCVQAQQAVIRCLRGEKAFQGRLPVKL